MTPSIFDLMRDRHPALIDAALAYAARGLPVFPCHETGDRAKAPRTAHGFHDATTDPDTVAQWWQTWPGALVGLPVPAGLLVLDIDPRHGGSVDGLAAALGPLPDTLTAISGRGDGGRHLWFTVPGGLRWPGQVPSCDGVDVRAGGRAYLIAPPSPHPDTGNPYRWDEDGPHTPAPLPAHAVDVLTGRNAQEARRRPNGPQGYPGTGAPLTGPSGGLEARRREGMCRRMAAAQPGERNATLNRLAYAAACELTDVAAAHAALAQAAAQAGLTDNEIQRTLASAARAAHAPRRSA